MSGPFDPRALSRRAFLARTGQGLGALATASWFRGGEQVEVPHVLPKAKRVIYLFMAGGPS